jgi:O-antigen ligase
MKGHPRGAVAGVMAMPVVAASLWFAIPRETFERLATIPSQIEGGDLNQRLNIWDAGWHAFVRSPLVGSGAGTFTVAAGTDFRDTAHNSELSILVGGGLIALFLALGILALAARAVFKARGPLQLALATVLVVWGLAAQVDTVEENRATWLLLGLMAVAGRLAAEEPERLEECFPAASGRRGDATVLRSLKERNI